MPHLTMHHSRSAAVWLWAAVVALVVIWTMPAHAQTTPPTATPGTPVLGTSLLSAQQMADWYRARGYVSRSPTGIDTLARLFEQEGRAQGVRADLAFAQTMLETGQLRYGGQVRPSDHNFSGLGACDSCARGLAFPNPQRGVRAQIQHLWAYAALDARGDNLAHPLVDIRFDLVTPKGKAPTWEVMGGGNWATDPAYAGKVLRIWHDMLSHAGLAPPAPSLPPGFVAADTPLLVRVDRTGAANLAGWAAHRGLPDLGTHPRLGAARTRTAGGRCEVMWDQVGVRARTRSATCSPGTAVEWVRLHGPRWRTAQGLAIGADLSTLRRTHARARGTGRIRALVVPRSRSGLAPLRAQLAQGQVTALWVSPLHRG